MKIYHNHLASSLKQELKPFWLVFGDDAWQKNDSLIQIKAHAQQVGFSELIRFIVDKDFDWQQLYDEYQSLSLFASQRIIEVEINSGKIGDKGSEIMLKIAEKPHHDIVIILHGPRLEAAITNRKWFKTLVNIGCYLPLYNIEGNNLQQWLHQQCRQLKLKLEPSVFPFLMELFEGNLLALAQELEKLSLLYGENNINLENVQKLVINQAKFNPFQLIDALLLGNLNKVIAILDQQQQEGAAIGQLIWFIHKEINQLITMQEKLTKRGSQTQLFKEYRIWDQRKPFYQYALTHLTLSNLNLALARLAEVDLISKTSSDFNPFILLADVCITLYHGELTQHLSLAYEYD